MSAVELNPLGNGPSREAGSRAWQLGLADHYSAMADDSGAAAKKREAAMLLSIAEGHLEDEEDYEEAVRTSGEAQQIFQEMGDKDSAVDALSILVDATHFAAKAQREKEPQKEAIRIATEALAGFKEEGYKRGQAAMLLALSALNISVRGGKKKDEGIRQSKEALAAARESGDSGFEANTLLSLMRIYSMQNNKAEAISAANKAIANFKEVGDKKGEARALHAQGLARFEDEQFDEAQASFKAALATFAQLGDRKMEAFEQDALAQLYLNQERTREALSAAKDAVAIAQEVGPNKAWHTQFLTTLIDAYVKNKEPEAGVKLVKKALSTFREAGETKREIDSLNLLANTLVEEKDPESALPRAEEALSLAREVGDRRLEITILHTIGRIQFERKEFTETLSCVKEMVPVCMALDDPALEASAHHLAVTVHMARQKYNDAQKAAKEAKELLSKSGDKHAEGRALLVMSTVHRVLEETDQAVSSATEAQFTFQKEKDKRWEARALFEVSEIQALAGNATSALRAAKKCLVIVQELVDKESQAIVLCLLASLQLSLLVEQCLGNKKGTAPAGVAEEALKAQERALEACNKSGGADAKKLALSLHFGVAQVHIACKRTEEAMTSLGTAETMATAQNDGSAEVVSLVLQAYCNVMDMKNSKANELADRAITIAKRENDERGEWLSNNIKEVISKMDAGGGDGGGEDEIDPEMLKLKIQDVANSLMGIESLAGDTPLMDAGLDSLSMVEFRNELVKEFPGVDLPGALLFDYPTVNALADFVSEGIKRSGKALK